VSDLVKSLILGVIQGLTEFLPISSSGHLYIFQYYLDFEDMGLALDVMLHLGTLLAVIIYFRTYLLQLFRKIVVANKSGGKELSIIIAGVFPTVILGLFFGELIESSRSINMIIFNYLIMGSILYLIKNKKNLNYDINYKTAIFIGFMQSFALLPGISRSGITIACAILVGIKKKEAVKFSFVMSIPLILGASIYKLGDIAILASNSIGVIFSGFIISAIVGYIAISWMMRIIEMNNFWRFSIYCWVMAIILLFSGI